MSEINQNSTKHAFLLDLIPHGQSNAVGGKNLDNALKCNERTRYLLIEQARKDGAIICSCNEGYYQPETHAEMLTYYETAHAKAITILTTLKATRKALVESGVKVK